MEGPTTTPQGGISFRRTIQVRPYETAEASIWISFDLPRDENMSDEEYLSNLTAQSRGAYFAAKALVFEELGLEFSVDDNGVIREAIQRNLGNVTEVRATDAAPAPAVAAPAPAAGGAEVAAMPPYSADTADKGEKAANKQWALARWASNPSDFWDNRATKRNPKGPDLKHKETGLAVWLS